MRDECYCFNIFNQKNSASQCNTKCADCSDETCGGSNKISVYKNTGEIKLNSYNKIIIIIIIIIINLF